tara:strand:+ start:2676 stop:3554 length:879 start_codon:yes stop_codon:yes gene_type:complete
MTPETKTIVFDELLFECRYWKGPKPAIVLLHGLSSTSMIWDLICPKLIDSFSCYAIDLRGHGNTSKPNTGYDFHTMIKDINHCIQMLGLNNFILIGHSWGGNLALNYASIFKNVDQLILIDGGFIEFSAIPGIDWPLIKKFLTPPDVSKFKWNELVLKMKKNQPPNISLNWNDQIESIRKNSFIVDKKNYVTRKLTINNHLKILKNLYNHHPSDLFSKVRIPTKIIEAKRNNIESEVHLGFEFMKEKIFPQIKNLSNYSITIMQETLHDIPLHKPDELVNIIKEFVKETTPA